MRIEAAGPRPLVLFVCRHGAAKSVLAAADLDRLARQIGVAIEARAAGIEPDAMVAPAVAAALAGETRRHLPRPMKVAAEDLAHAWRTITFDLEPWELPEPLSEHERWDGLPPANEDPYRTLEALEPRLRSLLAELADGR